MIPEDQMRDERIKADSAQHALVEASEDMPDFTDPRDVRAWLHDRGMLAGVSAIQLDELTGEES